MKSARKGAIEEVTVIWVTFEDEKDERIGSLSEIEFETNWTGESFS